jgi:DNA end-binding protein Ku
MARALWNGSISFGLVSIPVGLHSAVDSRGVLSFRLLHRTDESPIEYKRFCSAEGVEVPWKDISRGYEYAKGRFAVLTEGDFARARVEATRTFDIQAFVPARDIDYLYFDHPYYLAPASKDGGRAYALLRDALRKAERVGIGTIVLRQREHLAALEPAGPALTLTTMRFAHEIRRPDALGLPLEIRSAGKEMALADQLIAALAAPWRPGDYRDRYTDVLKDIARRKAQGKPIPAIDAGRRPARILDLTRALQESLKARRGASHPRRPGKARRRAA